MAQILSKTVDCVDHRYKIQRQLGKGSFSQVYLAHANGHDVALKLLNRERLSQNATDITADFKNEFSILKELKHPHIAGILDFGYDPELKQFYFTSEYVDGLDLFSVSENKAPEELLELMVQALRAFNYIHAYRIYHLDVKTANLLVTHKKPHQVKLIDFGLATMSPGEQLVGTPSYMAPEIIRRQRPDGRADIYSLGVLFYYCITRNNPFRAKGIQATFSNHLSLVPDPPSSQNPKIPRFLDDIILHMIEKNPGDRYQTVEEILRDINAHSKVKFPVETQETLLSYLPDEGHFIGRIREKSRFRTYFSSLFDDQESKMEIFVVQGDHGVGKTRFLKEMRYHAELHEVPVLQFTPSGTDSFAAFCDTIRSELTDDKRPCAFFLDDIDQLCQQKEGERTLLSLLARLRTEKNRVHPVLFVGAYCTQESIPEELRDLLQTEKEKCFHLHSFLRDELAAYVHSLTGVENPPAVFLAELWKRTEGNPLLTTEILRSLIETGALFDKSGRWKATVFEDIGVDFSRIQISKTLEDLLLARVERTAPLEQNILQLLAVAHSDLTVSQLQELLQTTQIAPPIEELRRHDLIERDTEQGTYRIQNTSLAETIYAKLSADQKSALHDRLAPLYEENSGKRAYHEMRGANLSHASQVAAHWGESYLKKAHSSQAIDVYRQILDRLPQKAKQQRIEFLLKLSEAYLIGLDFTAAETTCDKVNQSLKKLKGSEAVQERIDAFMHIGALSLKLGKAEQAQSAFQQAQDLLGKQEGPSYKDLTLNNFQARLLLQEGSLKKSESIFRATRRQWELKLSEDDKRKVTNNDLGLALLSQRRYEEALKQFESDLTFFDHLEDTLLIARGHYNVGEAYQALQDYPQAISHYKNSARHAQKIRNSELLLRAYNGLGNAYHLSDNLEQSISYYERGLALCERIGDLTGQVALLVNLGSLYSHEGEFNKAQRQLQLAISLLRNKRDKTAFEWQSLCRALLEQGEIARRTEQWETSAQLLDEGLSLAEKHAETLKFWILYSLTELNLDQDDFIAAEESYSIMQALAITQDENTKANELRSRLIKPVAAAEPPPTRMDPQESDMKNPYAYILKINQHINAESDLNFVLKTVLHYALEFCSAESGLILLQSEQGLLDVKTSLNLAKPETVASFSRSIAEQAIASGQWVLTADAQEDERFSDESSITGLDLKSVLCFPIRSKQKTIGALYLENRCKKDAFANLDMDVLNAFADQVGIAIENARLLDNARMTQEKLEARVTEMSGKLEHFQALLPESISGSFSQYESDGIIGRSKAMRELFLLIDKITDTDLSVFIHGESGTGKELVARALHQHSQRGIKNFVAINCGAIPANLMESELFGYKAGAFTGASRDKMGLVEEAQGGTLFLDEIGALDPMLQVKLVRLLQEGEFRRVGDSKTLQADIRIVSASNQDIEKLVQDAGFREDLFYRLCQIRLDLPPLRERPEDIPLLTEHFVALEEAGMKRTKNIRVAPSLMKRFVEYTWPGNIRELENLIKVAIALSEKGNINESSIPSNHGLSRYIKENRQPSEVRGQKSERHEPSILIDKMNAFDPNLSWNDYKRFIVAKALVSNRYQVKACAEMLGLAATTLYKKVKEWKLDDRNNPLFRSPFEYTSGKKLSDYTPKIFKAALKSCNDKPYTAIAQLKVSPGFFYKILKS